MTMLAILATAANLAAMKATSNLPAPSWSYLVFGSMPMASLLLLVLFAIVGDLRRSGEAKPFAVGFFLAGGVGMAVTSLLLSDLDRAGPIVGDWLYQPITSIFAPLVVGANGPIPPRTWRIVAVIVLTILGLLLPQLIAGLIGGFAAKRIGLKLLISREGSTSPARSE